MKSNYVFLLALFVTLGSIVSCRKKVVSEEATNYTPFAPPQCFNGVLDTDELLVDCGGVCPCEEVVVPCGENLENNTLVIRMTSASNGSTLVHDTVSIVNVEKSTNGSLVTYSGVTSNNMNIEIKLDALYSENFPAISTGFLQYYTLEYSSSLNYSEREASVRISGGDYGWSSQYFDELSGEIANPKLYWNSVETIDGNQGESVIVCSADKLYVGSVQYGTINISIELNLKNI